MNWSNEEIPLSIIQISGSLLPLKVPFHLVDCLDLCFLVSLLLALEMMVTLKVDFLLRYFVGLGLLVFLCQTVVVVPVPWQTPLVEKVEVLMVDDLLAAALEFGLHPEKWVGPVHRMDECLQEGHQFHTWQGTNLVPDF